MRLAFPADNETVGQPAVWHIDFGIAPTETGLPLDCPYHAINGTFYNATIAGSFGALRINGSALQPENATDVMLIRDINDRNHLLGNKINQWMCDGYDGLFWFNNKTKTSVASVEVGSGQSVLLVGKGGSRESVIDTLFNTRITLIY